MSRKRPASSRIGCRGAPLFLRRGCHQGAARPREATPGGSAPLLPGDPRAGHPAPPRGPRPWPRRGAARPVRGAHGPLLSAPPSRTASRRAPPRRSPRSSACPVDALRRGRHAQGRVPHGDAQASAARPTRELLPKLLEDTIREVPFRKSMRWADLDFAFGRPDPVVGRAVRRRGRVARGRRQAERPRQLRSQVPRASAGRHLRRLRLRRAHAQSARAGRPRRAREGASSPSSPARPRAPRGTLIEGRVLDGREPLPWSRSLTSSSAASNPSYLDLPERVILEGRQGPSALLRPPLR
jgi:hypothetical protein